MQARNALLVALPALVVGVLFGLLFAVVFEDPQGAVIASSPGAGRGDASAAAPRARSTSVTSQPEANEGARAPAALSAPAAPKLSERELGRAMAGVSAPAVAALAGEGTIRGRVLDAVGAPLPGAVIVASAEAGWTAQDPTAIGADAPPEPSLEEYLRAQAEDWARNRAWRQRTASDASGAFVLSGLDAKRTYQVSAYAPDYVLVADGNAYRVLPGETLTFRAKRVREVPVALVFEDGTTPAAGVVAVTSGKSTQSFAWAPEQPSVRLSSSLARLRGYAGLFPDASRGQHVASTHASDEESLSLDAEVPPVITLVLKPRPGIHGRVIDPFASGGRGALVRLRVVPEGESLDLKALARSDQTCNVSRGSYSFLDLAHGSYAVGVSDWNGTLFTHALVTVEDALVETDLTVPEPNAEECLVVRATSPAGAPLTELEFGLLQQSKNGSTSGGIQGRLAPDGSHWLRPAPEFFELWAAETRYTLSVTHAEFGKHDIGLEEGQREVAFTFEEPVSIVVVVDGYARSSYVGRLDASFRRVVEGGEEQENQWFGGGRRESAFNAEGEKRKDGLAPGLWEVSLLLRSDRHNARAIEKRELRVVSGETRVVFDLPVLYELVVVAPSFPEEAWVIFNPIDGDEPAEMMFFSGNYAQLDSNRRARFEGLTAGRYSVNMNGMNVAKEVTVPCGEVYLENSPPNCLRVSIGDLEGPLYAGGLRAGDLIIGVDGSEFGEAPNAWSLLMGSGSIELLVLRAGERLEIRFEKVRSSSGGDWLASLGGMLSQTTRP